MKFEFVFVWLLALIPAINVFLVLKDNWIKRVLFSLNALVLTPILSVLLLSLIYNLTTSKQENDGFLLNPSIATLVIVLVLSVLINFDKIRKLKKEKEEK